MKRVAACAISAVLFYLSIGAGSLWELAWFAPVPLLVLGFAARTRRDVALLAAAAAIAFAIGMSNLLVLYHGRLPILVLVPSIAIVSIVYGATVAWFAICARRSAMVAIVAFAATWTALEWILSLVSPHGTAGSIAYSQGNVPFVLQLAAVVGQYGITFVLCLVPAACAGVIHDLRGGDRSSRWRAARSKLALVAGIVAALVALRVLDGPERVASIRVAIVASDGFDAAAFATTRDQALAPLGAYEAAIGAAARDSATLVVLPERVTALRAEWREELDAGLRAIAIANHVELVAGIGDFAQSPNRNLAVVYHSNGTRAEYAKRHLLPDIEAMFAPGTEPLWLDNRVGVAICKDLDFQDTSRAYRNARVVLAPAWDFVVDGEIHRRMAAMRTVEGGFALVRSARAGYLSVHDAWGHLIAERRSSDGAVSVLVADVPLAARRPWFLATPFGFATILLALGCIVVVAGMRRELDATT